MTGYRQVVREGGQTLCPSMVTASQTAGIPAAAAVSAQLTATQSAQQFPSDSGRDLENV